MILMSEVLSGDGLGMLSLLLLMGMNGGDIGGGLIARWLGCPGLLPMANEILQVLNGGHCNNCAAWTTLQEALLDSGMKTRKG